MLAYLTNPIKRKQYILLLGDIFIVFFILWMSYCFNFFWDNLKLISFTKSNPSSLYFLPIYLIFFYIFQLYQIEHQSILQRLFYSTLAVLSTTMMFLILFYIAPQYRLKWNILFANIFFKIIGLIAWRQLFFKNILSVRRSKKLLFIGSNCSYETFAGALTKYPVKKYEIVGAVTDKEILADYQSDGELGIQFISADIDIERFVRGQNIDAIVLSLDCKLPNNLLEQIINLKLSGLKVYDMPNFYSSLVGKVPAFSINSDWVLHHLNALYRSKSSKCVKKIFDLIAAILGLLISCPLFVAIAIAIKLDSKGSVFFKQERLGLDKKPFTVIKFRTMVEDAEAQTGPKWAEEYDPRVTRVGKFLRKSRLDELPQLVNILIGKMSLVGFRPIRKHFADDLDKDIPFYSLRFTIKPGLTGWPQVQYDYAGSKEGQLEKLQYELFYIQEASIFLDIYIILKTPHTILFGRGQ